MKIFHIAAWLALTATFIASSAQAQMLNGKYGGEGEGTDVNGAVLHQVTKWTFKQGKLVAFEEIISFANSVSVSRSAILFPVRRRPTRTRPALQAASLSS